LKNIKIKKIAAQEMRCYFSLSAQAAFKKMPYDLSITTQAQLKH
jgi:hypothetical protein